MMTGALLARFVGRSCAAIVLQARDTQAAQAVLVDQTLPGKELFDGQGIALAGFLEAQQTRTHACHDLGLAADNPALRTRRGQVIKCDRHALRAADRTLSSLMICTHSQLRLQRIRLSPSSITQP